MIYAFSNLLEFIPCEVAHLSRSINDTPKQHRKEHEMVILDPNHSSRSDLLTDGLRKLHIGLTICQPILLVKVHLARMIVEKGPEDRVGETVVVSISDVIVKIDGLAGVLFHQTLVNQRAIFWWDEETRPTDPGEVE